MLGVYDSLQVLNLNGTYKWKQAHILDITTRAEYLKYDKNEMKGWNFFPIYLFTLNNRMRKRIEKTAYMIQKVKPMNEI